jgi:hypothetical protein
VKIIKPADPLVDADWLAKMKRWQYRAYTVGGKAVPFCHVTRVEVRAE